MHDSGLRPFISRIELKQRQSYILCFSSLWHAWNVVSNNGDFRKNK